MREDYFVKFIASKTLCQQIWDFLGRNLDGAILIAICNLTLFSLLKLKLRKPVVLQTFLPCLNYSNWACSRVSEAGLNSFKVKYVVAITISAI